MRPRATAWILRAAVSRSRSSCTLAKRARPSMPRATLCAQDQHSVCVSAQVVGEGSGGSRALYRCMCVAASLRSLASRTAATRYLAARWRAIDWILVAAAVWRRNSRRRWACEARCVVGCESPCVQSADGERDAHANTRAHTRTHTGAVTRTTHLVATKLSSHDALDLLSSLAPPDLPNHLLASLLCITATVPVLNTLRRHTLCVPTQPTQPRARVCESHGPAMQDVTREGWVCAGRCGVGTTYMLKVVLGAL